MDSRIVKMNIYSPSRQTYVRNEITIKGSFVSVESKKELDEMAVKSQ